MKCEDNDIYFGKVFFQLPHKILQPGKACCVCFIGGKAGTKNNQGFLFHAASSEMIFVQNDRLFLSWVIRRINFPFSASFCNNCIRLRSDDSSSSLNGSSSRRRSGSLYNARASAILCRCPPLMFF